MINLKHLKRSFHYAFRGLMLAGHENTFRVLLLVAAMVGVLMVILPLPTWQVIALIMVIMVVLVLEIINTMFERMADLVEPKMHHYVRELKDLMAAAVFLASVAAFITGLIIFTPYI
jgi:diacylglycerol kinase